MADRGLAFIRLVECNFNNNKKDAPVSFLSVVWSMASGLVDPNVPEPGVGGGRQRQDHRQLIRQKN